MYYFFYRTGCYDCVRVSNLSNFLVAQTICDYQPQNCTYFNFNLF